MNKFLSLTIMLRSSVSKSTAYGSFTLPDTETDTDRDKMCAEPNRNLHRSPFSVNVIARNKRPFYEAGPILLWDHKVLS